LIVKAMVLMVVPNIIFDATAAECIVRIIANKVSRKVVATMELWRGSIFMDSWRGDGQWTLELNKTADVQENRAYTFFTHGVLQTDATFSKITCLVVTCIYKSRWYIPEQRLAKNHYDVRR